MNEITNGRVLQIVESCGGDTHVAASNLKTTWPGIDVSVDSIRRRIQRLKKPRRSNESPEMKAWLETSFITTSVSVEKLTTDDLSSGRVGRPRKRLCDQPGRATITSIMDEPINDLMSFAEKQGVSIDDVVDLLNARRRKDESNVKVSIPTDEAVAYFFNGDFSSRSWTELRLFLRKFGVELPSRNVIDSAKKDLHPPVISHELKCSVPYRELIVDTVLGIVKAEECGEEISQHASSLQLAVKTGLDGSGSHRVRHQVVDFRQSLSENPHIDPHSTSNYLLCCVAPLSLNYIDQNGDCVTLWKNPSPNSIAYTRPLALVRAVESRTVIEIEFSELFNSINAQESYEIPLPGRSNESPLTVRVDNTVSMIDGKMVGILQGDMGSNKCHYCTSSVEERNNIINILQGFLINKDFQSCMDAWSRMQEGEGMSISTQDREGQCQKPLVPVRYFAILHWKLRSLDFALNILYRLIAGIYVWGKCGQRERFINAAKKEAQNHIREKLGILIDVPTAGGGNTNNGSIAERFFDSKNRSIICELIKNESDRENYSILLRDVNIILSVCLSSRPGVDVTQLRQLGIDIMAHIRTKFVFRNIPWIPINPSLHAMCAHSWQLFEMHDPISDFSEQAQEHWNKNVAKYKSGCGTRARQHSVKLNIRDVFTRMLQMTHPIVVSKKRKLNATRSKMDGEIVSSDSDRELINNLYSVD